MIMTVLRQQPRAAGLVLGLIAANFLAWCWALQAFGDSGALMAASLLAWGYGLRHAVDADHIAAIDNVTRKMMQQGRRPFAVGAWFSLGHSSIVVLASAAIAATATAFSTQMSWLHDTGSVIGTAVSALFLLAMAFINLVILRSVWRSFRAWKRGEPVSDEIVSGGGVMSWLFGKTFRLVSRSWQMYLVGFLFGLGFDTATEIGVLGISAASASSAASPSAQASTSYPDSRSFRAMSSRREFSSSTTKRRILFSTLPVKNPFLAFFFIITDYSRRC